MPNVTVFKIKCFDVIKGEERILGRLATRSGARLLGDGFDIIEGTGIEVDASQLERGETWGRSLISAREAPGGFRWKPDPSDPRR